MVLNFKNISKFMNFKRPGTEVSIYDMDCGVVFCDVGSGGYRGGMSEMHYDTRCYLTCAGKGKAAVERVCSKGRF